MKRTFISLLFAASMTTFAYAGDGQGTGSSPGKGGQSIWGTITCELLGSCGATTQGDGQGTGSNPEGG